MIYLLIRTNTGIKKPMHFFEYLGGHYVTNSRVQVCAPLQRLPLSGCNEYTAEIYVTNVTIGNMRGGSKYRTTYILHKILQDDENTINVGCRILSVERSFLILFPYIPLSTSEDYDNCEVKFL